MELNYILPIVKIETLRTNKTFKADTVKIFDEEKKITQNVEIKNVDIIDLSKNNSSKNRNYTAMRMIRRPCRRNNKFAKTLRA